MLDEKLGKVLNVFSPSDMSIINAILNCGVGGEIESARSAMNMVEELNPDGGYVYPVHLYPTNWFQLLDSSFTGVDLLESPAALSQKVKLLEMQRSNLMMNISKLTSTIPDDAEVALWNRAYEEAEASFRKLMVDCVNVNVNATADAVKGILSLCSKKSDGTLEAPSKIGRAHV